jgi:hypothetical protein
MSEPLMLGALFATVVAANGVLYFAVASATARTRFYKRLSASQAIDLDSRLVGCVNVALCLANAHATLWRDPAAAEAWHDPFAAVFIGSPARNQALVYLAAFLFYDAVLIACSRRVMGVDWAMLLHHAIILSAVLVSIAFQRCTFHICCLLVNEASTPFLTVRYFLLYGDRTSSRAYAFNGMALVISFAICRIVANTLLVYACALAWHELGWVRGMLTTHPNDVVLCGMLSALALGHWSLNLYWFVRILSSARRALRRVFSEHAD